MSKSGDKSKIKAIISHPQALAQCSDYIERTFGNVNLIEETSTSAAAKRVKESEDDSVAAIANETAAEIFNLKIVEKSINDEKDNKTRFIMLARKTTKPTGFDKTSIAFSTKNEAGALYQVLKVFGDYNLNLSYIDSRPSKKNLGEYTFFIDFEGHVEDDKVRKALEAVKEHVHFFKINGSFKRYKK